MSKKKAPDHLDDFLEWQAHRYDPVYYTGGRLHPFYKAEGSPLLLAIWFFFQAAVGMVAYYAIVKYVYSPDEILTFTALSVFFVSLIFLSIWIGIRHVGKHRARKRLNKQRAQQHRRKKQKK
jgi:hypothetical protein